MNFPLQKLSRRGYKDKIWITKGIKISSNHKNKLYRKWTFSRTQQDYDEYRNYNKVFKNTIRECQLNYYKSIFNAKTNSMKKIWNEINTICSFRKAKNRTQIPKLIINNDVITDSTTTNL